MPPSHPPPVWETYSNLGKEPTTTLACDEYPNIVGYTNCLSELYKNTKRQLDEIKKCDPRRKSELQGFLKQMCDVIFESITIEEFDKRIEETQTGLSNTRNFLKVYLAQNGIDINGGKLKLSGCAKDGVPPDQKSDNPDIFERQTTYGGRYPYLQCPLSKKLPWEDDDQKYCTLLMQEFNMGSDSTMGYLIDDLYHLKKKSDEDIIKEYATKLRTLAITELLEKYAAEFGSEMQYPGDLNDPNNICYKSSIQQKFNDVMKKTPLIPTDQEAIALACKEINAQITGKGEECAGEYCGVKLSYLESNSIYKDDVIARQNAIKETIHDTPILSSLFEGKTIDSNSFPDVSKCTSEDGISSDFIDGMKRNYKENLNKSLELLCSTENYPDSLLYRDKRLTRRLGQYSRYGELQKCIEEEMQDNADTMGTVSSILGGSALIVGVFFPPGGLALGIASTAMSVGDAAMTDSRSTTMNIVSTSMGNVEAIAERKREVSSKTKGAVFDVVATASGVKTVQVGVGTTLKGGKKVLEGVAAAGDLRSSFNSSYSLTSSLVTDLYGRPVNKEFYELPREEKERIQPLRYVQGYEEKRKTHNQIIQENFFLPVSEKLSDLEAAALSTLLTNISKQEATDEEKAMTLRNIRYFHRKDKITLHGILEKCEQYQIECPKSNSDLK